MKKLKHFILLVLLSATLSAPAIAQQEARYLLGGKPTGSSQKPHSVGFYSKGCLAGGKELSETGPYWQAMRLSRGRNWGHPDMVAYLKRISKKVASDTSWKGLYVGDISQPRGGPMISGHASHQMGLDADIWMLPPKTLKLSRSDRESISSISMRSKDQKRVSKSWTRTHMEVMKIAALDPAVDRIFVTPPVKIYMCNRARGDKKWLQKIRPYWGHHYHFHVRLKCPKGSTTCKTQKPTVSELSKGGTGCDKSLNWWVTTALKPAKPNPNKKPKKKKKHPRQFTMADLPSQCGSVLRSK